MLLSRMLLQAEPTSWHILIAEMFQCFSPWGLALTVRLMLAGLQVVYPAELRQLLLLVAAGAVLLLLLLPHPG